MIGKLETAYLYPLTILLDLSDIFVFSEEGEENDESVVMKPCVLESSPSKWRNMDVRKEEMQLKPVICFILRLPLQPRMRRKC